MTESAMDPLKSSQVKTMSHDKAILPVPSPALVFAVQVSICGQDGNACHFPRRWHVCERVRSKGNLIATVCCFALGSYFL